MSLIYLRLAQIRNQERRIDEEVAYWDVARYLAAALSMGSHTTAARPASMQLPPGQNAERDTSRDDTDTLGSPTPQCCQNASQPKINLHVRVGSALSNMQ